ncbi:MAG: LytTR family DNA-binding domain-containing protein [Bacteroidota bacterium]
MKILIVEDEPLAADRLEALLRTKLPEMQLLDVIDTVEDTVEFLQQGALPDLAFFDIQLADGLSFSVFDQVPADFPVVFTTAFDQYALRAFEVNSIDYLLKPIKADHLDRALNKFQQRHSTGQEQPLLTPGVLQSALSMLRGPSYKERFVVKSGANLLTVSVEDILYFWSQDKMTWIRLGDGRKHVVDYTLEQLDSMIDPQHYFRVNRKYCVRLDAIQKATVYSNSRLKLHLPHLEKGEEVVVSREKVQPFKTWLSGD